MTSSCVTLLTRANIDAFLVGRVLWYSCIEAGVANDTVEMAHSRVSNQNNVSCLINGLKDSGTLFWIDVALTHNPLLPYACDLCFPPCSTPYTLNPEDLGFKPQTLKPSDTGVGSRVWGFRVKGSHFED